MPGKPGCSIMVHEARPVARRFNSLSIQELNLHPQPLMWLLLSALGR